MIKCVQKLKKGLIGEIIIPADKSISHRAVMLSALSKGKSIISNFSNGADCHSTLNLFKQLGTKAEFINYKTIQIEGSNLLPINSDGIYYCGNSCTYKGLSILERGDKTFNGKP